MKRMLLAAATIAAMLSIASDEAHAQANPATQMFYRNIYDRPTVSPYLNLLNPAANSGATPSYFTMVRPQLEQRAALVETQVDIQQLRQTTAAMARRGAVGAPGQIAPTGHQTRYMYYGSYYQFPRQQGRRF